MVGGGRNDLASRVFLSFMMQNEIKEEAYVRLKTVLAAHGTSLSIASLLGLEER